MGYTARCPYFKYFKNNVISCEGVITSNCCNYLDDKETAKVYYRNHCCCDWESCMYALTLCMLYEKRLK